MLELADMKVWQKARLLCVEAYRLSERFPPKERFRLTDQICRAGISAINNIAEGFGREGGKDFACHLRIARGSVGEVRSRGIVACDLNYVSPSDVSVLDGLGLETYKRLTALLKNVGGLT